MRSAAFCLTSIVAGRLAARFGTRLPILVGLAGLMASAWIGAALPTSAPFFVLAPALVLMGVGPGLVAPSMNAAILASVPAHLSASRQVGTALGVAIFASLFHGPSDADAVHLALVLAGFGYAGALALAAMARSSGSSPSLADPARGFAHPRRCPSAPA